MHKISNFTGTARHGWEKMGGPMGFGSRNHNEIPINQPVKRTMPNASGSPGPAPGTLITQSFNVPFNSTLPGPEPEDIQFASPGAFARWTHPEDTTEGTPNHKLPVHASNVENLRSLCRQISEHSRGALQATVTSSEPKALPGLQRGPLKALITNVCLHGEAESVKQMRARILNETPISLRSTTVDIDEALLFAPGSTTSIKRVVLDHLDETAKVTKADIFLLRPKQIDETSSVSASLEAGLDQRYRCVIFGDMQTAEHAKTRILIFIDQLLHREVDMLKLELSMHTLICGKARKNIKFIESATNTAIYFPPAYPKLYGFCPPGAQRREEDQIIITGQHMTNIQQAKKKLSDLVLSTKVFVKEVAVTAAKLDNILLERLDKVQKIIETNGSYVLFPPLGLQRGVVRVQATSVLEVERTVREIMALAGQFYSAAWWISPSNPPQRQPTTEDIRKMLSDVCINAGAEIGFEGLNFHITGSDDAVKAALMVIHEIPFVKKAQYTMRVKIELANEHKEFVSGKKNGKINKIMSASNVQIVFDGFNEYNFYIDVRGHQYEAVKNGLDLVEQEMPASISFHVPDQYHKRIIGIGGQHIQRIMKKYSVFVKFSNAMDRGGYGKEEDDMKVDNVICRTPARNAASLDHVKAEIMDMVEKADAEFVSEHVVIDRLLHRELIAQMGRIEELEKKWNCKITFPSTEQASDLVTVSGPEYQVPQAVDEFLAMVPENHELTFTASDDLKAYLASPEFTAEAVEKLKTQHEVDLRRGQAKLEPGTEPDPNTECLILCYTRNNAGGLKDAIDFLTSKLVLHSLDASTVKGNIPRPKSDSFENSLPYFESKLLHGAPPDPDSTDSPTRSAFGDGTPEGSGFFSKFRKPGSMSSFTSLIGDRRKNGSNSPNSLFRHASSNASKASLISLESQGSGYRNPWNDSGINLPEEDHNSLSGGWGHPAIHHFPNSSTSKLFSSFANGGSGLPGDTTPRYDPRASVDSGRPSTSHSVSGYPGPIGPPR